MWVIPQFGVDPELYHPAAPGDPQPPRTGVFGAPEPPGAPLHVGFAGRLVAAKGADLVVQALAGLGDVEGRLELVGEGPEQPRLEALAAALGVRDRVTFTPWLSSAAMPDFYRSIDVLVLPSRRSPGWIEQFGRVLIEAMASGVACVGSDSGEIPHVIGDAGLVFPEDDARALAGALARLGRDAGLRRALGEAGRARAIERFSMARVVAETAAVYRAALGAPKRSG